MIGGTLALLCVYGGLAYVGLSYGVPSGGVLLLYAYNGGGCCRLLILGV
jgi:hypothetical protein